MTLTLSGNGQKLVEIGGCTGVKKQAPANHPAGKESGNGPSLGCAVQEENDHPKGES